LTAYEDHGLGRIYYVEFDPEEATVPYVVNQYISTGLVEYAEPNYFVEPCEVVPDDEYYDDQWYLDDNVAGAIRANRGWFWETGDPSIRIAVLDSGISLPHPDLNYKIIWPRDTWNQDDRPLDYDGHGTKVAGIIAAETNNEYGFEPPYDEALGIAGTSWGSLIVPVKITTEVGDDTWWTNKLHVTRGINWAMTHHARIINMSFGAYNDSDIDRDVFNAAWDNGHLLIASAGNDGLRTDEFGTPFYPAFLAVVMAVSAIDGDGVFVSRPKWTWASNYGNHIELCAPGVEIKTTHAPPDINGDGRRDYPHDPEEQGYPEGYRYYNRYVGFPFWGTSAAAPVVSGVAALKWAQCPNWTNQQIRDFLNKSAWDLGTEGRDDYYGFGRVDALRALGPLSEPVQPAPGDLHSTVGKGVFALYQNRPNPVSDSTVFSFSVPEDCGAPAAELSIYDITGRRVAKFEEPLFGTGEYTITWDRTTNKTTVGSGVYLYKLAAGDYSAVRKMVIE